MNFAPNFLLLLPLGLLACSLSPPAEAAPAASTQALPPAKTLILSGAFSTTVTLGEQPEIVIDGPADRVVIEADQSQIKISRKPDLKGDIKLRIVMAGLERLELSGAQKIQGQGLKGKSLTLDFSGAAAAELAGEYDAVEIDLSGASKLDAARLQAKTVKLEASGASNVEVNASEQLRIDASGASKVRYRGNPAVEKDVSGVASVSAL